MFIRKQKDRFGMTMQVLIATMNQKDHSLLDRMNIQTDAIVGNQCDRNEIEVFKYKGHMIKWLNFDECGVGLNRNNALFRATADICILADDDMRFVDGYPAIVSNAFSQNEAASVIVFNINDNGKRYKNKKVTRIYQWNYAKYGAARLAFRRENVLLNGISFNLFFGGGCKYSNGEDTLFLKSCLDYKLKICAVPEAIAHIDDTRISTWFQGYNDKYFFDKGVLFCVLNRKLCKINAMYHCWKHRKKYTDYGWVRGFYQMHSGIDYAKKQYQVR